MLTTEKVKLIAKILKKKFTDLTTLEATHVAYSIVEALDKAASKVEKGNESS